MNSTLCAIKDAGSRQKGSLQGVNFWLKQRGPRLAISEGL
jgi:hypothetical protein